ncbi:hypothetical protein GL263_05965 [Streptomyces durbertensis]|uniref:Uncharacterized protein n=1 Tax=Streptomyces durbertensis TaxID=2448886 RepID=A0ABR6ECQ8_9ACTN|nr:hypothetical protein [Streptomyces durbertensis]
MSLHAEYFLALHRLAERRDPAAPVPGSDEWLIPEELRYAYREAYRESRRRNSGRRPPAVGRPLRSRWFRRWRTGRLVQANRRACKA